MRLEELLTTGRFAAVTQEAQVGVLGDSAIFPALADHVREIGALDAMARVVAATRQAGGPVLHAVAERRLDGMGSNSNARLFAAALKADVALTPGSAAVEVMPELLDPSDLVSRRLHGIGPFSGTDLDALLRNLGVRTIIALGVSVNIGLTNLVFDAVNLGYQVILPRDAVAGIPGPYADDVIEHTLSLLATVTTSSELVAAIGSI